MSRLRHRGLAGAGIVVVIGLAALLDFRWLDTYRYSIQSPDFFVYYLAARVGASHGWASIYDPSIFLPLERVTVGRPLPYLNPPELAWMVLPLSLLPYSIAAWIWRGVLVLAAATTWWLVAPGRPLAKALHGLSAIVLLPVFISIAFGQVSLIIVALVAIAWALIERERQGLAGITLSLLILKPQLAFFVPVCLLLAGYRRAFLGWLGATAGLAIASFLAVGPGSLDRIAHSLALAGDVTGPIQLSLLHQLPLPMALVAMAITFTLAVAVVLKRGRGQPGLAMATGLIASVLLSPYLNFYDLSGVVLAAWLLLRLRLPGWYASVLVGGYVAVYVAPILPLVPVGALALGLALLLAPWRREPVTTQFDMQSGAAAA